MEKVVLSEESVPAFPRGVKFRFNNTKQQWVILAPERLLVPDETAVEVLKLVDGNRTLGAIADDLAARFQAPRAVILTDITAMLQDLADKAFVIDSAGAKAVAAEASVNGVV